MGLIGQAHKVNLIAGLLSNDIAELARARDLLKKSFGNTDLESPIMDFTYTNYYSEEMGQGLKRQFISFKNTFSMDGIFRAKIKTNRIEARLSSAGKRRVNIDPGYIDLSKLVLFSTKDFSHRIYLGKGIFAEVTLMYKDKSFSPIAWTYPDYRTSEYISLFNKIRQTYKAKTV